MNTACGTDSTSLTFARWFTICTSAWRILIPLTRTPIDCVAEQPLPPIRPRLRVAALFALAAARACLRRVDDPGYAPPPSPQVRVVPDNQRYGWFVSRDAFGRDLYSEGRNTILRFSDRPPDTAGAHLTACW